MINMIFMEPKNTRRNVGSGM